MIDLLLILIFPIILSALPFVALLFLANLNTIKYSALKTGITALGLTVLNIGTSLLAFNICAYGITRNLPVGEPKCVTGATIFIMLGVFFTVLTLVLGITYTYRHYGYQKNKI